MVLNQQRKLLSGWSNYSGTVISLKMRETEIGYRGSKSITEYFFYWIPNTVIVKEQRVDGSYIGMAYSY